jgi:YidC/Oxa1 family membrane protein insertase
MENNNSFKDPKTIIAIFLMAALWIGWQWYMQKKYPHLYTKNKIETESKKQKYEEKSTINKTNETKVSKSTATIDSDQNAIKSNNEFIEKTYFYKSEAFSFEISTRGMGLKNIVLNQYFDREKKPKTLGQKNGLLPFETTLNEEKKAIPFTIVQKSDSVFVGVYKDDKKTITKTMEIIPELFSVKTKITLNGNLEGVTGVSTYLTDKVNDDTKASFLMPVFDKQEFYVAYDDTSERIHVKENMDDKEEIFKKVELTSLSSQYFTLSLINNSDTFPKSQVFKDTTSKTLITKVFYPLINKSESVNFSYTNYVGPKSYDILKKASSGLENTVDYGMFSFIAKYILKLLKFFHNILGNWGWAIILLTLVVRLLILPLAISSYKSMKKMQDIQPQLKQIRENLKDDPQKMNLEVMKVMKESKANPLSGCLPMLLQFPIFLALYQVLGQSIELYQAPFVLWIKDLSLKDPYYILPVLMGLTMFIQQKITPTTMDPTQAKVMMIMPVLFSFFMISLPSGLTLYIFVSTLFGVAQQLYFLSEKTKEVKAV